MLISVLTAVGFVALLTLLLATLLIFASKKLAVHEDPRLDVVEGMLPHNNCGACGYASCRMFAEALVSQEASPSKCTVSSEQGRSSVADFLHVEAGEQVKRVVRLACAGGNNVATTHAIYQGRKTCADAAQVVGGGKTCNWGCIGFGDCAVSCDFSAITMNEHGLPEVDEDKCTACGDCVEACPKQLFSIESIEHHLWVACKNEEQGDHVLDYCQLACTACGRCAVDAPNGLITMTKNLPNIDLTKKQGINSQGSINRCPTGAIIWFDDMGNKKHGASAQTVIRNSVLPNVNS